MFNASNGLCNNIYPKDSICSNDDTVFPNSFSFNLSII